MAGGGHPSLLGDMRQIDHALHRLRKRKNQIQGFAWSEKEKKTEPDLCGQRKRKGKKEKQVESCVRLEKEIQLQLCLVRERDVLSLCLT